jgi:hypothetical protein
MSGAPTGCHGPVGDDAQAKGYAAEHLTPVYRAVVLVDAITVVTSRDHAYALPLHVA